MRKSSCLSALLFPVLFGTRETFIVQRNRLLPFRVGRNYGPG